MSRGHGAVQRFVLEYLANNREGQPWERWVSSPTLARERAGREPTTAELESMRRAIRKLEADGAVEARLYSALYARLPLNDDERKAEEAWLHA